MPPPNTFTKDFLHPLEGHPRSGPLRLKGDQEVSEGVLSHLISRHLSTVAGLFSSPDLVPGANLRPPENRSSAETELLNEIRVSTKEIGRHVTEVRRNAEIRVKAGFPKPSWPHVYYVSFHDTRYTRSPTEGYYPVFLLTTDHETYWLSLLMAAASVGVSGRGGWSAARGQQLQRRAAFLARNVTPEPGWRMGPIPLGPNSEYLHRLKGRGPSAAKAYECGAILSRSFSREEIPENLSDWLVACYGFFDRVQSDELPYLDAAIPRQSDIEFNEQRNAAITGRQAETFFAEWCKSPANLWGKVIDHTQSVGLGFDFEFPDSNIVVEVKGFLRGLGPARLTETEWKAAQKLGRRYFLCLVSGLAEPHATSVHFISDPFGCFQEFVTATRRIQLSFIVPRSKMLERLSS